MFIERAALPTNNGCRKYVDIITGGKMSSLWVANMELVDCSVRSSSRSRGDEIKEVVVGDHYFSQLQVLLFLEFIIIWFRIQIIINLFCYTKMQR